VVTVYQKLYLIDWLIDDLTDGYNSACTIRRRSIRRRSLRRQSTCMLISSYYYWDLF